MFSLYLDDLISNQLFSDKQLDQPNLEQCFAGLLPSFT